MGKTVLTYSAEAFPRLQYNLKSYQQCVERRNLQELALQFSEQHDITVVAVGDTSKMNLQMISKKKSRKIIKGLNGFNLQNTRNCQWQGIPLVYFMTDEESISNVSTIVDQISSHIDGDLTLHGVIISGEAAKWTGPWETPLGLSCVNVPYSKEKIRQIVSIILEKPLFDSLRKMVNDLLNRDMQTRLELLTLLKHERFISESGITSQSYRQTIPKTAVDILKRRREITAFGIWQDMFFVFLKKMASADVQSEINSTLQITDDVFFTEMSPIFIYMDSFDLTAFIKQGDAVYRKDTTSVSVSQGATASCKEYRATVGAILRNPFSRENVYGLTSCHLFPLENMRAFTKHYETLQPCGKCILSFQVPDMAFLEFEDQVKCLCVTEFHDENNKPRKTLLYHDDLAKLGKVYKKGAESNWTEGMIISPNTYINEGNYLKQCFVVEGTSGRFSSPGDSGSIIFAHSPDHSHLLAVGIVTAGEFEARDTALCELMGRQEADMKNMTFAFKLQPGFDKARENKPSLDFIFEDVESSSSESDDD